MEKLTEEKWQNGASYYHEFHDGTILKFDYDCVNGVVDMVIQAYWIGDAKEPKTERDQIHLAFKGVRDYHESEYFSNSIDEIYIKFVEMENIGFAIYCPEQNEVPELYFICTTIEYEKVK